MINLNEIKIIIIIYTHFLLAYKKLLEIIININ